MEGSLRDGRLRGRDDGGWVLLSALMLCWMLGSGGACNLVLCMILCLNLLVVCIPHAESSVTQIVLVCDGLWMSRWDICVYSSTPVDLSAGDQRDSVGRLTRQDNDMKGFLGS